MVDLIFRLLVTLLHQDSKYKYNNGFQISSSDTSMVHDDRGATSDHSDGASRQYRTAARIHLVGDAGIIEELTNIHENHEQIRILGKSILKDLFQAEIHAAVQCLRYVFLLVRNDCFICKEY